MPLVLLIGGARSGKSELALRLAVENTGDTLWLTPLLRALHAHFPSPHVTLVAPPVAATVLAGNPHLDELVAYLPREGEAGRRRVLAARAVGRFMALAPQTLN